EGLGCRRNGGGWRRATEVGSAKAELTGASVSTALQLSALIHVMTTAIKITVVRILMIPAFVTMAIYYGESIHHGTPLEWMRYTAIAIFVIAAVSDGLDGYVARHYKLRSSLGVILDLLADQGLLFRGVIKL